MTAIFMIFALSQISFVFLVVSSCSVNFAFLRPVLNFLTLLQLVDVVAQSRFELVLRVESQLRPRPRDVHPWTRGSQFPTAHPNPWEYFSERLFEVFDRGQRSAAKVVNLVRQRRRVHRQGNAVGEIL